MIRSGLVSVSFRQLSCEEVIELVKKGKLDGIEWGGDVHVPPGDVARAKEVGRMTREAGLEVAAYGSYFDRAEGVTFEQVLASAVALEAPTIRIWAGKTGSADTSASDRAALVAEGKRAGELAKAAGISVAYEWHSFSLTDTNESAVRLLEEIDCENVKVFWQPDMAQDVEYCLAGLRAVLDQLVHVHAFYCPMVDGESVRMALADGADVWRQYLEVIDGTGREHFAMLEFVRDDSPEQFLADAATLRDWLGKLGCCSTTAQCCSG